MLTVSVSPHIKSRESVEKIMWTVVACLIPPLILSVFVFGFQTLIISLISVGSCVAVEAVSQKLLKRPVSIRDGSAVVKVHAVKLGTRQVDSHGVHRAKLFTPVEPWILDPHASGEDL